MCSSSLADGSLGPASSTIRRHAIPSLLSEALCSRAKRASEKRPRHPVRTAADDTAQETSLEGAPDLFDEVPFARRAREEGIKFSGGKADGACSCSTLAALIDAHPCRRILRHLRARRRRPFEGLLLQDPFMTPAALPRRARRSRRISSQLRAIAVPATVTVVPHSIIVLESATDKPQASLCGLPRAAMLRGAPFMAVVLIPDPSR